MNRSGALLGFLLTVLIAMGPSGAYAQAPSFIPPPRSIADITAILESEKPDAAKLARYVAQADAQPQAGILGYTLGRFYLDRAIAASQLGRIDQWIADAKEALRLGEQARIPDLFTEARRQLAQAEIEVGDYTTGIDYAKQIIATAGYPGVLASWYANLSFNYALAGDLAEARAQAALAADAIRIQRTYRNVEPLSITASETNVAFAYGVLSETEGRYGDAEREYNQAVSQREETVQRYDSWLDHSKGSREYLQALVARNRLRLAYVISQEGRLAEAESIARRALLDCLRQQGRYAPDTASAISALANIILDEGRVEEARQLAVASADIYQRIGASPGAHGPASARLAVANALAAKGAWRDAMAAYDTAGLGIGPQDLGARELFAGNLLRTIAELKVGRTAEALSEASELTERREQELGAGHPDTLEARGVRAAALYFASRKVEALTEFRASLPKLIDASRINGSGEGPPVLREIKLRFVAETYIGLLSETKNRAAAAEAFALADVIRGQAVRRALAQGAARVSVRDPALAELVRREQDARSQISALFALLANVLAVPADQRDDKVLSTLHAETDRLRGEWEQQRDEIEKRFPDYANLIDPPAVTIDQVRSVLNPEEALMSFYLGDTQSFVWAVTASGEIAFASVPLSSAQIGEEIDSLRRALAPNASTLAEIPAFDTERAYELYAALLEPVEAGWRSAKSLLVVPHGPLGQMPLALLPTAPGKYSPDGTTPFDEYKKVPWLVRRVSVTQLPSVTSLVTLRSLPAGDPNRRSFAGFGDPWFNETEADEAQGRPSDTVIASRGAAGKGLHIVLRSAPKTETEASASIANLPRLPDTAEEVRGIAVALGADLDADVFLGAQANEETALTTNLANRHVIMFATHGLVPGDLDGLEEPALALTAPSVAHVRGDGLLTMSKILGLKLDADWVVLSACNTAAGNGTGAEAVSGLGRAFFYAGTRALLVSNWPVETTSARTLTTDLFRRQSEQPGLARAEALRQAELALIDGPGFVADGKTSFSYAHPIFWAPFAVIGDGGVHP